MKLRKPFRLQLTPIFVGCEGDSESGYAALIQDFAREHGLQIHFQIKVLAPGAGDPLARVKRAIQEIERLRRTRSLPSLRFIFLDQDQADQDPNRAREAIAEARQNDIHLIWQNPCFEAMILRHLPQQRERRPPDSAAAVAALVRIWPEYRKGYPRAALATRIHWDSVIQAAQVETDLDKFLRALGFSF